MKMKLRLCAMALMTVSRAASAECQFAVDPGISPPITLPTCPYFDPASLATSHDDRSWHLLTQSYGGTITLLRDLTKRECEYARHRAKGEPATEEEIKEAADAETRRKAELNKYDDELKQKLGDWVGKHGPCNELMWTNDPSSSKGEDGLCVLGNDILGSSGMIHNNDYIESPQSGDIKSAECFQ